MSFTGAIKELTNPFYVFIIIIIIMYILGYAFVHVFVVVYFHACSGRVHERILDIHPYPFPVIPLRHCLSLEPRAHYYLCGKVGDLPISMSHPIHVGFVDAYVTIPGFL